MPALKTPGDIMASDTSVTTDRLQENQDFPLLVLDLVVFPRLAHTMFKTLFNNSHVCSVLQMDYFSLSQWFFAASSILEL